MITFPDSLKVWATPAFEDTFKIELGELDNTQLPLQQCLVQSSYVSETAFNAMILDTSETPEAIKIKTGIFFSGVIAGSCCADDPTPLDELTEYCEVEFVINKLTAEAEIILVTA